MEGGGLLEPAERDRLTRTADHVADRGLAIRELDAVRLHAIVDAAGHHVRLTDGLFDLFIDCPKVAVLIVRQAIGIWPKIKAARTR